jgi:ketosteroid isomerase-like protein
MKNSIVLASMCLALGTLGCASAKKAEPAAKAPMPAPKPAAEKAPNLQEATALFNAGDFEKALQGFAEDAQWHPAGAEPATGRAGIKALWEGWKPLAPKAGMTRHFSSGDMWVAEGVFSGSQVGEFNGAPATNKPFGVHYVHVGWNAPDGRVKKILAVSNGASLPMQLGLMPGQGAAVAAAPEGAPARIDGAGNEANLAPVQAIFSAWKEGKNVNWEDVAAADCRVNIHTNHTQIQGLEAIAKAFDGQLSALKVEGMAHETATVGNFVILWGTNTVRHVGALGKLKATNKLATYHVVQIYEVKDGKIVEVDLYSNPMELMGQLIPPKPVAKAEG